MRTLLFLLFFFFTFLNAQVIENNIALASLGATASDNGYFDDYGVDRDASNTIDGDSISYWAGLQGNSPQTMWIQFDKKYSIDKINIVERKTDAIMLTATVRYYDGISWNTLLSINKSTAGYFATFSPVEAEQIELQVHTLTAPGSWYNKVALIYAFEVNGSTSLLSDSLVAYYPFNANTNDESGNGHDGQNQGALLTADRFGNQNAAYRFSGSGSNIDLGNDTELNMTEAVTCLAWVKVDSFAKYAGVFTNYGGGPNDRSYHLGLNESGDQFEFHIELEGTSSFTYKATDSSKIISNRWYFIAGTFDGNATKLYVNGQLVAQLASVGELEDCSHNIRIGTNEPGDHDFFGVVDDARLYNVALSQQDISDLYYDGGWTGYQELVASYLFNGNADDGSVYENDGVVYGPQLTSDRFGNMDAAYIFDGVDDYIEVAYDVVQTPANAITISAWLKIDAGYNTSYEYFALSKGQEVPYTIGVRLNQYWIKFGTTNNNNLHLYSGSTPDPGWHFISGTFDGNTARMFVDGQQVASAALSGQLLTHTNPLTIGRESVQLVNNFPGSIDDIRIYNYALDDITIDSLYCLDGWCEQLAAYYPFNGDITDATGHGYDGTNYGAQDTVDRFNNAMSAFHYDGSDDYVIIPFGVMKGLTNGSVNLWLKFDDENRQYNIFADENYLFRSQLGGGTNVTAPPRTSYYFQVNGESPSNVPESNNYGFSEWHMYTYSWDNTSKRIYLDGLLIKEEFGSFTAPLSSNLVLSPDSYARPERMPGTIDDLYIFKEALSQVEIDSLYCLNGWCEQLVAYYPFNNNTDDESGNENNGILSGATFSDDLCGTTNSALSFDSNDFVTVPHSDDLNFGTGDFSIVSWLKIEDPGQPFAYEVIEKMNRSTSFPNPGFFIRVSSGNINPYISDGGSYKEIWGDVNIADDDWHQVAMVCNRSADMDIYVDGQLDKSIDISGIGNINVPGHDLFIGKTENNAHYFTGDMDEIRLYNYALSEVEIQELYNITCPNVPPVAISQDVTINANNNCVALVTAQEVDNGSYDPDGDSLSFSLDPAGPYAIGDNLVTLIVFDGEFYDSSSAVITVEDKEPIADAVLVASNSIWLKQGAEILSGNIIVNDTIPGLGGPYLSSNVELTLGKSTHTQAGYSIKAHRIKVKQNAEVNSDLYYNELNNNGTINGDQYSELELSVFCNLPVFESQSAGTTDLTVNDNDSVAIDSTVLYRDITIRQQGVILFTGGGTFVLNSLNAGIQTKILFDSPTKILIADKFDTDKNSYIGPVSMSGIDASDITFFVAGINGNNGNLSATPKAAQIGLNNNSFANFYVPNGTLWLRENSDVSGAFIARDIIVGINTTVTMENSFGSFKKVKVGNQWTPELTKMLPAEFKLDQNYPNPFNPSTTIIFSLPKAVNVKIDIFNLLGQHIRTLVQGYFDAGEHKIIWDAAGQQSGVYYYRIISRDFTAAKKMILLK